MCYLNKCYGYTDCYEEMHGFGYVVTTSNVSGNVMATYSCWPGYTYKEGNLGRTCLPKLVWSGRRPTCEPSTCELKVRQKCVHCTVLTDFLYGSCLTEQLPVAATECLGQLSHTEMSVAVVNGSCYKYTCTEILVGVSDNSQDWTAKYTCSRGKDRDRCIALPVYIKFAFSRQFM